MTEYNAPAKQSSTSDLALRDHYEILLDLCRSQVDGNSVHFLKKRMDKFFEAEHAQWFLLLLTSTSVDPKSGQLMDSDSQPYDLPRDTLFSFDELAELFELYTRIYPSEKKLTQLETCLEYLGLNQYANQFAIRHNLQAKADHKIVPPLTAKHMPRMEKTSSYSTNKSKPKHPIAGDDIWILYVWYVIKFGGPAAIVVLLVWQIITYQLSRF